MNDNEKIRIIRESLPGKVTLEQFANSLNLKSKSTILRIEKGEREVTDRIKNDVLRVYNVNPEWWETGEGDIFLPDKKETATFEEMAELFGVRDKLLVTMWPKLTEKQKREHLKRMLDDLPSMEKE